MRKLYAVLISVSTSAVLWAPAIAEAAWRKPG